MRFVVQGQPRSLQVLIKSTLARRFSVLVFVGLQNLLGQQVFAQTYNATRPRSVADHGLERWAEELLAKQNRRRFRDHKSEIECAKITELKSTIVCVSLDQEEISKAFARASAFAEGVVDASQKLSAARGTVLPLRSAKTQQYARHLGGADLLTTDVKNFFRSARSMCRPKTHRCFSVQEKRLYLNVIKPLADSGEPLVVLAAPLMTVGSTYRILGHEIIHAQFFEDANFRRVVGTYFETLPDKVRESYLRALGELYDLTNRTLVLNEFAALVLQPLRYHLGRKEWIDEGGRIREDRQRLTAALREAGINVVLPELPQKYPEAFNLEAFDFLTAGGGA